LDFAAAALFSPRRALRMLDLIIFREEARPSRLPALAVGAGDMILYRGRARMNAGALFGECYNAKRDQAD